MFWLHLKWLFWSINSIRPLFEALRRGQIFGQNYAWNHNLSADLFFFDIYMSLRAISLLKMPKHVTSSLQMTMSKNLSMDPQIFFLMVPKTDDGRKKRLENAFFKSVGNVHMSTQMGLPKFRLLFLLKRNLFCLYVHLGYNNYILYITFEFVA